MSNIENKKPTKGLTDKELIKKYEAGTSNMDEATRKMLDKPSNTAVKSNKQKSKR